MNTCTREETEERLLTRLVLFLPRAPLSHSHLCNMYFQASVLRSLPTPPLSLYSAHCIPFWSLPSILRRLFWIPRCTA